MSDSHSIIYHRRLTMAEQDTMTTGTSALEWNARPSKLLRKCSVYGQISLYRG